LEKVYLLVIDPQHDFVDPKGALYVEGAEKDMERLAGFVKDNQERIDRIFVSLDTHRLNDISHPIFWNDTEGKHPAPFTLISKKDLEDGKWMSYYPAHRERSLEYVNQLEQNGHNKLCIWPPHCLLGGQGHSVYAPLFKELVAWEEETGSSLTFFLKGINQWTEHYSIFQAEVPDPLDPTTDFNSFLLNQLIEADRVLVAGEASSHCVAASIKDLVKNTTPGFHKKIVLLKDTMSPVKSFSYLEDSFFEEMSNNGLSIDDTQSLKFLD